MEQGLYAQVVMICQMIWMIKRKRKIPGKIDSRGSLQDQYASSVLIISG